MLVWNHSSCKVLGALANVGAGISESQILPQLFLWKGGDIQLLCLTYVAAPGGPSGNTKYLSLYLYKSLISIAM